MLFLLLHTAILPMEDMPVITNHAHEHRVSEAIDAYEWALYIYQIAYSQHEDAQNELLTFDEKTPYYIRRATEPYFFIATPDIEKVKSSLKIKRDIIALEVARTQAELDQAHEDLKDAHTHLIRIAGPENMGFHEGLAHIRKYDGAAHHWMPLNEYQKAIQKNTHKKHGCAVQ